MGVGVLVGIGLIALDAALAAAKKTRIPPLAVGIGIYLPMSVTFAVVAGAIVGHWYNKRVASTRDPGRAERLGVLVASGMIVGESLFGVLNAGLIVALSSEAPIALVPADFAAAQILGPGLFVALVVWLYRWMLRRA